MFSLEAKYEDGPSTILNLLEMEIYVECQAKANTYRQTTKMTFLNATKRSLSGDFIFNLPDGATICGYSLDVEGEMVDASLVEVQKAEEVFNLEEEKGNQVSLAKLVSGNQFKTRIFPLKPERTRTIQVNFISDLERVEDGLFQINLALDNENNKNLTKLDLKLKVIDVETSPRLSEEIKPFSKEVNGDYTLSLDYNSLKEINNLKVFIPTSSGDSISVEENLEHSQHFFNISSLVKSDKNRNLFKKNQKIALMWDSSLSRDHKDVSNEVEFLKKLLFKEEFEIDLYQFSNDYKFIGNFTKLDELSMELSKIIYDGGTNLNLISQILQKRSYDFGLLFSDGFDNLSNEDYLIKLKSRIPIYSFNGSSSYNSNTLSFISNESKGGFYHIDRSKNTDLLNQIPMNVISCEYNPEEVSDVVYKMKIDEFLCTGVLLSEKSTLKFNFGYGKDILETKEFVFEKKSSSKSNVLGILWAQRMIQELLVFPESNKDQILSIGRKFSLVTPGTSLIVLENLEQYITYKITPPKQRDYIYQEYIKYMSDFKKKEITKKDSKMIESIQIFNRIIEWYEKDHMKQTLDHLEKSNQERKQSIQRLEILLTEMEEKHQSRFSGKRVEEEEEEEEELVCRRGRIMKCSSRVKKEVHNLSKSLKDQPIIGNIKLNTKLPNRDYFDSIESFQNDLYSFYLLKRIDHKSSSGFYLDMSDYFYKKGFKEYSLKILSNILEIENESSQLLRIVAYKLEEYNYLEESEKLFRKVLQLNPKEPQSFRDLALVLGKRKQYKESIQLLYKVVLGEWSNNFKEIEETALIEMNRLISLCEEKDIPNYIDKRFIYPMKFDLRVVMAWDTSMTDIDLHVIEPTKEEVYYSHRNSFIGGRNSRDFTKGYGPETYMIKNSISGKYQIDAKYFSNHKRSLTGGTTILLTIFTNYGDKEKENMEEITMRLVENKERINVAEIEIQNDKMDMKEFDKLKEISKELEIKWNELSKKKIEMENKNRQRVGK